MIPQGATMRHFAQLRDASTVRIRRDMLCPDIHCDFAQIEVRADIRRHSDARRQQHVLHNRLQIFSPYMHSYILLAFRKQFGLFISPLFVY